ncbi:MAG: amidohydrolase family protein, partial [Chloroflexi bacterium]|nr:amidohydrolase family protein [Chloroflexota bacterium]
GLLGRARATCCLCPTTERDLGDGIGPAGALAGAGARLAVGTDSNAVIDPFEEARGVELDERLSSGIRGRHPPESLLTAATASGYAALGWPDGGQIRPGALADFTTISLTSTRTAGIDESHALDAAVFAATAADVHHVVVDGRVVVREGRHLAIDVAHELAAAVAESLP